MPIQMHPQSSTDSAGFSGEPGTYVFKLASITIGVGHDYDDNAITYPQARITWADSDGDSFQDSFVKIPLGFRLNDKAKWTNRLSALVGRPLKDEDAQRLSIDLGPDVSSYDELDAAVAAGKTFDVLALTFDGQTLMGREAQLTLGINPKGYNTCAAAGASPLPSAGGKKKKPPVADDADVGDFDTLLSAPPKRRANTTEPAHADY